MKTLANLPDVLLTEILARLSMRCISRFKSVCKTWKITFESLYFRRRFLSLHQNSSPSWSLIRGKFMEEELMGSYGCQTWNLPKSPYSYFPKLYLAYSCSSNGLVMLKVLGSALFVGNPVLQKWVKIPKAPYKSRVFGLVTRVDEDGVVLSFKVVELEVKKSSTCMHVHIYSSETGIWTSKQLQCHNAYSFELSPISLNGTLYLLSKRTERTFGFHDHGVLIAHDFYSETDQCQVISLPSEYKKFYNSYFKGYLTTSGGGFLMYIDACAENAYNIFKIWKLNNDSTWQLLWKLDLSFLQCDISYGEPIAMHPFDSDIVYLRCYSERILVSHNLRTQNYRILRDASKSTNDHQDCLMGDIMEYSRFPVCDVFLYQFVLPRWMESIPCPPQTEIINTASLFLLKRKRERSS